MKTSKRYEIPNEPTLAMDLKKLAEDGVLSENDLQEIESAHQVGPKNSFELRQAAQDYLIESSEFGNARFRKQLFSYYGKGVFASERGQGRIDLTKEHALFLRQHMAEIADPQQKEEAENFIHQAIDNLMADWPWIVSGHQEDDEHLDDVVQLIVPAYYEAANRGDISPLVEFAEKYNHEGDFPRKGDLLLDYTLSASPELCNLSDDARSAIFEHVAASSPSFYQSDLIDFISISNSSRVPVNVRLAALAHINLADFDPSTTAGSSGLAKLFYGLEFNNIEPKTQEMAQFILKIFETYGNDAIALKVSHLDANFRGEYYGHSPTLAHGKRTIQYLETLSKNGDVEISRSAQAILEKFKHDNPAFYEAMAAYDEPETVHWRG